MNKNQNSGRARRWASDDLYIYLFCGIESNFKKSLRKEKGKNQDETLTDRYQYQCLP